MRKEKRVQLKGSGEVQGPQAPHRSFPVSPPRAFRKGQAAPASSPWLPRSLTFACSAGRGCGCCQGNVHPLSTATGSKSSTSRCSGRGMANISSGRKSSTPSTSWWISTGRPPSPRSSRSSSGTRTRARRYRQGMGPWGHAELGCGVMTWLVAGPGWEPVSGPFWDSHHYWYHACHHCGPWGN